MGIMKWDPFEEFENLQDKFMQMVQTFEEPIIKKRKREAFKEFMSNNWMPRVNVLDENDKLVFTFDLPGMQKKEIDIKYEGNTLVVKGERKQETLEEGKNFIKKESHYGTFSRAFPIGIEVDEKNIKANYKNGVLEIVLPKIEKADSKQLKINID
jgi:HSP20 family protein